MKSNTATKWWWGFAICLCGLLPMDFSHAAEGGKHKHGKSSARPATDRDAAGDNAKEKIASEDEIGEAAGRGKCKGKDGACKLDKEAGKCKDKECKGKEESCGKCAGKSKVKGKDKQEPPGWDRGEKKGWDGEDTPPGWDKKSEEEKKKFIEKVEEAKKRVREYAQKSREDQESAEISVEKSARMGVPVDKAEHIVRKALEKGMKGRDIAPSKGVR